MRNLKRALSLTLASVMLLGMMVVGAGAASFPDVDDNDNVEAIGVLAAVGVIVGDNGNYYPDRTVTRNEMAVIMTNLLGLNAKDFSGTCPFSDVPGWAQDYVAACYANGIVAGRSATVYDGQATVTAVEAASMMMRALGYFKYTEDYEGGFTAATVRQAATLRLFDGVAGSATAPMTRNDVAQLALNTLEADVVDFAGTLGWEINGIKQGYVSKYEPRRDLNNNNNNGYNYTGDTTTTHQKEYLQLLEMLYDGKLTKGTSTDNFGRPATLWTYKDEEVKAPKETSVAFTASKSADDIAKELKGYKVMDNGGTPAEKEMTDKNFTSAAIKSANGASATGIAVANGASDSFANEIAKLTGNGKAVEIYANDKNVITDIVVLSYRVAEVSSITESKDGDYRKTAYAFKGVTNANLNDNYQTFTDPAKDDKIVIHGSIAKDDVVTILALAKETHVYTTTKVTGAQSDHNTGDNTIIVSGTTYTVATGAVKADGTPITVNTTDFPNSDKDYDYYLDQYGYVVKGEAVESNDYAVIDAIRWTQETTALDQDGAAAARLIFPDGHTENVVLNKLNGEKFDNATKNGNTVAISSGTGVKNYVSGTQDNNKTVFAGLIVTYTKNDDGKYELTLKSTSATGAVKDFVGNASGVSTDDKTVIEKGVPLVWDDTTDITGNNDTVYILKTKDGDDDVYTAYTGYQNVPTVKVEAAATAKHVKISYVLEKNSTSVADYVFIDATDAKANTNETGNMVYIMDASKVNIGGTSNDKYTYLEAALNGTKQNVTFNSTANAQLNGNGLYKVEINNKGEVTKATEQTNLTVADFKKETVSADAGKGVVNGYTYKGDEKVWIVDGTEINSGSPDDARKNDTIFVKVVDSNATGADKYAIKEMYIVRASAASLADTNVSMTGTATTADTHDKPSVNATVTGAAVAVDARGIFANSDTIALTLTIPANAKVQVSGADATTSLTLTRKGAGDWTLGAAGDATVNKFTIVAADGTTTKEYTITVTEKSQATQIDASASTVAAGASNTGITGSGSLSVGDVTVGTNSNTGTISVTKPATGTAANGDTVVVTLKKTGGDVIGTATMSYDGSDWSVSGTVTETTADSDFSIVWTIQ